VREVVILAGMTKAAFFDTMGKRVRILRDDKDLNQTELAQLMAQVGAPIDPSYLSQIEGDTKMPRLPVLRAIAQTLETTTDYLLLLTDDPAIPASAPEPDAGHGVSVEAQEIANLVDALPPRRQRRHQTRARRARRGGGGTGSV